MDSVSAVYIWFVSSSEAENSSSSESSCPGIEESIAPDKAPTGTPYLDKLVYIFQSVCLPDTLFINLLAEHSQTHTVFTHLLLEVEVSSACINKLNHLTCLR